MSDDENEELSREEAQQKQLQFVGYGIAVSGVLALVVATISTQPSGILVFGLGGLAVMMLVLEQIQGGRTGLSLGLLTGSFGAWLWPHLDGESYVVLGFMLVVVGAVNVWLTPKFHQLGARLAEEGD